MDALKAKKIDELFQLWQDHPGPGGQLVVSYKGEVFERCYGYQNIETQTRMTQESVFHLASMTKPITAVCIYMLFEQGKLDLQDDVKKYLPDLVKVPQKITISNMLHHTSGLPDHYSFLFLTGRNQQDTIMQDEMLRLDALIRELNFEPGDEFMYSNPNYVFLATIVERISGMTLNQFCTENIFKPLGMEHTFIRDDPERLIPNRVQSYNDDGYEFTNAILNICMYGSTALQSTARDMNIYFRQYANPTLISRETMDKLLTIPSLNNGTVPNYAGGVRITEVQGHKYIHHGGVNAAFRTVGQCYPDDDLYITLFTNTYNIPIEPAATDVARIMLDLTPRTMKNLDEFVTDQQVDPEEAAGFYYSEKTGTTTIINVVGGKLCHYSTPLIHMGGNLYKLGRKNLWFAFGETLHSNENNTLFEYQKINDRISDEQAADYVGEYFCEDFQSFWKILWHDGKLYLHHLRHGDQELHFLGADEFCTGGTRYTFQRDEQGKVVSMNRKVTQLRKMGFTKIS